MITKPEIIVMKHLLLIAVVAITLVLFQNSDEGSSRVSVVMA